MQSQSILIKKENASAPCIEISESWGYVGKGGTFIFISENSFLGDSHDGQVDFHLGPIFTLRRAMLFVAKAIKKRLAFFQIGMRASFISFAII